MGVIRHSPIPLDRRPPLLSLLGQALGGAASDGAIDSVRPLASATIRHSPIPRLGRCPERRPGERGGRGWCHAVRRDAQDTRGV